MVMRAKMGALPSAFGLPFCIINKIENVLLSISNANGGNIRESIDCPDFMYYFDQ